MKNINLEKIKIFIYAPEKWQQDLLLSGLCWSGKHSNFTPWVAQTYAELSQMGINFIITETLSVNGIVLADRDTLGNCYPFLSQTLLICAKSDREFHPSAHFHVSHNKTDESILSNNILWKPRYIPHWPIADIKPRDPLRGCKLENIAYIGTRGQLADQLKSAEWETKVKELGLNWIPIFESHKWNDYTNIDLIIAARKFPSPPYHNKGAIKLYNCWHGGVPALLAPESAFMAEKQSEYDFLPINSLDDAYCKLQFLKLNPEFYSQMLMRCKERAQTVNRENIRSKWIELFEEVESFHCHWQQLSDWDKKVAFLRRRYILKKERLFFKIATYFGQN